jgi:8-oxo-dGTP pyrophosphatase MutT (NUDIX family)
MTAPSFVVALVIMDQYVLAVSRRGRPDDLGLPGGSIEGEETPFDALVREVKEETNLDVHTAHHAFSRVDKTTAGKVAWAYVVTEWSGEPKQMEDGISVQWVVPERLLEDNCTFQEYNRQFFEAIGIDVSGARHE